jgi:SMI1-KNR4 cell-wall
MGRGATIDVQDGSREHREGRQERAARASNGTNGKDPRVMAEVTMSPIPGGLLAAHWSEMKGVTIRPSLGPAGIQRLENRVGLKLPRDFQSYLLVADGFAAPSDQDANGFRFWPSNEVVLLDAFDGGRFASADTAKLLLFADYLGWSWAYAIKAGSEDNSSVYMVGTADGRPRRVAKSFAEFVALYMTDDARIYG